MYVLDEIQFISFFFFTVLVNKVNVSHYFYFKNCAKLRDNFSIKKDILLFASMFNFSFCKGK